MEYTRLGNSGLKVSRICLGCLTYASAAKSAHPWLLDEEASQPLFRRAFQLGINFFDTADAYSEGTSEEFLGRAIRNHSRREDVVTPPRSSSVARAPGLDRDACRLPEVRSEIVNGTIFINFSTSAAPATELLNDLIETMAPYGPAELVHAYSVEFDLNFNWKIAVETFMESYHHIGAHAETAPLRHIRFVYTLQKLDYWLWIPGIDINLNRSRLLTGSFGPEPCGFHGPNSHNASQHPIGKGV